MTIECGPTHWDACPCRRATFEEQDYRLTTANIQNVKLESRIGQLEEALRSIQHVAETLPHARNIATGALKRGQP